MMTSSARTIFAIALLAMVGTGGIVSVGLTRFWATEGLRDACYRDDPIAAERWIRWGADLESHSATDRTPLGCALGNRENGKEAMFATVAVLLRRGADPNRLALDGKRPIALTFDRRMLALLKRYGARYR